MSAPVSKLRRFAVLGGLVASAAVAVAAPAVADAKPAPRAAVPVQGPEERQAITVVRGFAAALVAKDLIKAVSLTDEAIQYRDDPFQVELKKGRPALTDDLKILLRGLNAVTFQEIYAVGSAKNDVLVLVRRVDTFKLGEKVVDQKMGGYYRVRNGKILEWLDTPMVEMPPAPKGAGPAGGPPPGGPAGPPPSGAPAGAPPGPPPAH